jgi:hypothetical protein
MQTKLNRPLQKSDMIGQSSDGGAIFMAQRAVDDALILMPKIRAADLAEALLNQSFDFQRDLNEILARNFYIAACNTVRRKQAAEARAQLRLPGFEHLPVKISVADGKRIRLLSANREGVRAYYWSLMKKHSDRKRSDPQIIEAKALLDEMTKRARTEKGITVREVVLIDR